MQTGRTKYIQPPLLLFNNAHAQQILLCSAFHLSWTNPYKWHFGFGGTSSITCVSFWTDHNAGSAIKVIWSSSLDKLNRFPVSLRIQLNRKFKLVSLRIQLNWDALHIQTCSAYISIRLKMLRSAFDLEIEMIGSQRRNV